MACVRCRETDLRGRWRVGGLRELSEQRRVVGIDGLPRRRQPRAAAVPHRAHAAHTAHAAHPTHVAHAAHRAHAHRRHCGARELRCGHSWLSYTATLTAIKEFKLRNKQIVGSTTALGGSSIRPYINYITVYV